MTDSTDTTWSTYLQQTRELAEQIAAADDPYDLGIQFMGITSTVLTVGPYAGSMYTLWGCFTDAIELSQHDNALIHDHMRGAARHWLALDPYDGKAVRDYFQHWDEIVGHGR